MYADMLEKIIPDFRDDAPLERHLIEQRFWMMNEHSHTGMQRYAVGEIFIANPAVVPNARRDGFEDSTAWRAIRAEVKQKIARRVITLVREASTSRRTLKTISAEIDTVARTLSAEWLETRTASRTADTITRLLGRLKPEKLTGGDPNEVGNYISRLKTLRDALTELRAKPKPQPEQPEGITHAQDDDTPEQATADVVAETSGDHIAGSQTGDPDCEEEEVDYSAAEMLSALRTVLEREFGPEATRRLFALARAEAATQRS